MSAWFLDSELSTCFSLYLVSNYYLLLLFGWAMVKLKHNVSVNTIENINTQCSGHLEAPFYYALTGYGPKQLLIIALHQKLPRPSFKSNVNNILHCQACFLKLKFPWLKIF